jgi:hypothetical protein
MVEHAAQPRTMKSRIQRSAALVAAFAFVLVACGSSSKSTAPKSTTATSSHSTSTTAPAVDRSIALWPNATTSARYTDPVAAARGFATDYVGFVSPIVGTFRAGDSRSGEVTVRSTARGPVTTVLVRQLGSDGTWSVLGASTPNIVIAQPKTLAAITSPVRVSGTSTAFEATVRVAVRGDDTTEPLASGTTMGGSNGAMGPFSTSLNFTQPTSDGGAILMDTISAADGNVAEATVLRIHFAT